MEYIYYALWGGFFLVLTLILSVLLFGYACGLFVHYQEPSIDRAIIRRWFWGGALRFIMGLPMTFLGLFVVAIAWPFRKEDPTTAKPYRQFPQHGDWVMCRLPKWALQWDNPCDGLYGDKRGWWANENKGNSRTFLACWLWTAVRNPVNYYSRVTTTIDTLDAEIVRLAGTSNHASERENGWHFMMCRKNGEVLGCLFQVAIMYPFSKKYGIYARLGYKIEIDEPTTAETDYYDRMRASVWKFSPMKALD